MTNTRVGYHLTIAYAILTVMLFNTLVSQRRTHCLRKSVISII